MKYDPIRIKCKKCRSIFPKPEWNYEALEGEPVFLTEKCPSCGSIHNAILVCAVKTCDRDVKSVLDGFDDTEAMGLCRKHVKRVRKAIR